MSRRSANINVMISAVTKAGRALRRDFGEVEQLQVSKKGPADFVSTADLKAEKILREELSRVRPDFGFLMEEQGAVDGRDRRIRWVVDPLDGTTNFLHGLPHWAITIAIQEDKDIIAAVTFDPLRDELFWAERGSGAYLNDTRLRVSGRRRLQDCLLSTGMPFKGKPKHDRFVEQLNAFMHRVSGIRRFGSAALDLAYTAAGRYDGFWESGLSPWDMAAGILLVREAGGFATDLSGGTRIFDRGDIVAGNPNIQPEMLRILRKTDQKGGNLKDSA